MPSGRGRIAIIGEALVDDVPDATGRRKDVPGGSGLNTALAAARLGLPVALCASLSSDPSGRNLSSFLTREGVDLSFAQISEKPCPRVIVTPDAGGSPAYDLRLSGSALDDAPDNWSLPGDLLHLHATSFAATAGAQGQAALCAMQQVRNRTSTSFDPNIRQAILPDMAQTRALLTQRMACADLIKASAEDLDLIGAGTDLLAQWRNMGAKLIVVTQGALGATAFFGAQEIHVPSPAVTMRDTVGAGDTFMGAMLMAMQADGALGRSTSPFEPANIARWLEFAARAASINCARIGADPPRLAELDP
jgi:fructokinase